MAQHASVIEILTPFEWNQKYGNASERPKSSFQRKHLQQIAKEQKKGKRRKPRKS